MDTRHGSPSFTAALPGTQSANRALAFSKMEKLVREMQDKDTGITIGSQKLFLTSIPSAFMGYDLIQWLWERLDMEDSGEAIHLGNLLCQYGYFFPVGETRSLMIKDDSSLYRFQTPYYWPSQNHTADSTDYAIYLTKRLARNKQKHGLEDYEMESYNKLKKTLQHKWDFIVMQAEEQVKLAKDRKKGDKIVTDSQERAYWRVHRPPPGYNNILENAPVPDRGNIANRVRKKTLEERQKDVEFFQTQIERTRVKVSDSVEGLISYAEIHWEYDCFIVPPQPNNPWIENDESYWFINKERVDQPTEKRLKRWALSFNELISDPQGIVEFTNYLRKEYCHENIRFWQAVNDLRYGSAAEISEKVANIYNEFLKPGAPCEINIDGKTMELTTQQMKNPNRYTYDLASEHVYMLLLKKDCYPRFLRSEHYKSLVANPAPTKSKRLQDRFLIFSKQDRKKASTSNAPNSSSLQAQTPQPLKRHPSDEQTLGTSGLSADGDGQGGGSSTCMALQPRIDCEPPYSFIEKTFAAATAVEDKDKKSSEDSSNASVCPWEAMDSPPKSQPPSDQPKATQEDQHEQSKAQASSRSVQQQTKQEIAKMQISKYPLPSIPQGFLPKDQLSYPKVRPDRSKSMDVSPVTDQKQSLAASQHHHPPASAQTSLCTSPLKELPTEGSQKNEKSRSVDVDIYPWDHQHRKEKEVSGTTSLVPYMVTERRASEGNRFLADRRSAFHPVLPEGGADSKQGPCREVKGQEVGKKISGLSEKPETTAESAISEKSKVIISVQRSQEVLSEPKTSDVIECPPSPSSSCSIPSPAKVAGHFNIDYTVRSGHKPEHFVMPSSSQSPLGSPQSIAFAQQQQPHMRISTAAAFTSTTSTSTTTTAISLEQVKGTSSQYTQHRHRATHELEQSYNLKKEKPSSSQAKHHPVVETRSCSAVPYSSRDEACESNTPTKRINVVAPWEDEEVDDESSIRKTSDICPWEDEESCKVDTPFVKTYATLGYL